MSIIQNMLSALFPTKNSRCLMISLDAAGKTTILYKMKLGEVVTTIPTIGFNVETVRIDGMDLTIWDVGGCDKIRPLWRHYYQNTDAVIFVIDSGDRQRMNGGDMYNSAKEALHATLAESELQNAVVLLLANKQDQPDVMTLDEINERMGISALRQSRVLQMFPCSGLTGDGLPAAFSWLVSSLQRPRTAPSAPPPPPPEAPVDPMEALLLSWLERIDVDDDVFLQQLKDCSLDAWDHYTHLRIAWLILSRHGRQKGLPMIFDAIKHFIATSPRTQRSRGTTFHETMTYFWVHMVHYAMVATKNPTNSFKTFLLLNPQLSNGGLFLHYYSKQRMLHDADARTTVLLPDKQPLPSMISSSDNTVKSGTSSALVPRDPHTDEEFMESVVNNSYSSWGHDCKLRLIYLKLSVTGRTNDTIEATLDILRRIEKESFLLTINYFWIQLVWHSLCLLRSKNINCDTFAEFSRQPLCQGLKNQLLYEKYYSRALIDDLSQEEMAFPDIKPLPSIV